MYNVSFLAIYLLKIAAPMAMELVELMFQGWRSQPKFKGRIRNFLNLKQHTAVLQLFCDFALIGYKWLLIYCTLYWQHFRYLSLIFQIHISKFEAIQNHYSSYSIFPVVQFKLSKGSHFTWNYSKYPALFIGVNNFCMKVLEIQKYIFPSFAF